MGADSLTPAQRARAALLEHLSPRQRAEFERTRSFNVQGNWGWRYRIKHGEISGRFLFFPRIRFGIWPTAIWENDDKALALKLLAETRGPYLRSLACWHCLG